MRAYSQKYSAYYVLSFLVIAAALAPGHARAETDKPSIYEIRPSIPYPAYRIFSEGGKLVPLPQQEGAPQDDGAITMTNSGATMEFIHTRQDCRTDAKGAMLCNTWNVREVKILNLNPGSNKKPSASTIYYIHNTSAGAWELISNQPNAGYNPPGESTVSYNDKGG